VIFLSAGRYENFLFTYTARQFENLYGSRESNATHDFSRGGIGRPPPAAAKVLLPLGEGGLRRSRKTDEGIKSPLFLGSFLPEEKGELFPILPGKGNTKGEGKS